MNTHSSLIAELKDKHYRDAYIASQIAIGLPFQARALRVSKGWTQEQLAERAGMSQPRIAEIEKPSERRFNLETLLRIASAFDVGLEVRFTSFGDIIQHDESFDPDAFSVPTFDEELAAAEKQERTKSAADSTSGGDSALSAAIVGEQYSNVEALPYRLSAQKITAHAAKVLRLPEDRRQTQDSRVSASALAVASR